MRNESVLYLSAGCLRNAHRLFGWAGSDFRHVGFCFSSRVGCVLARHPKRRSDAAVPKSAALLSLLGLKLWPPLASSAVSRILICSSATSSPHDILAQRGYPAASPGSSSFALPLLLPGFPSGSHTPIFRPSSLTASGLSRQLLLDPSFLSSSCRRTHSSSSSPPPLFGSDRPTLLPAR